MIIVMVLLIRILMLLMLMVKMVECIDIIVVHVYRLLVLFVRSLIQVKISIRILEFMCFVFFYVSFEVLRFDFSLSLLSLLFYQKEKNVFSFVLFQTIFFALLFFFVSKKIKKISFGERMMNFLPSAQCLKTYTFFSTPLSFFLPPLSKLLHFIQIL